MKKVLMGATVCVIALPAAADSVYVDLGGSKERFTFESIEETSVCMLKRQVAAAAGLEMKDFNLRRGSNRLNDSRTLKDAYVSDGASLNVELVERSNQCR